MIHKVYVLCTNFFFFLYIKKWVISFPNRFSSFFAETTDHSKFAMHPTTLLWASIRSSREIATQLTKEGFLPTNVSTFFVFCNKLYSWNLTENWPKSLFLSFPLFHGTFLKGTKDRRVTVKRILAFICCM